ncbi:hypothetical protein, partial [Klebsiella pneumoniae]|uniref:hypothetical protein n=1 Tax=Klebsiella pneumoniae TaxID=573 RepID=UPI001D0E6A75
AAFAGVYFGDLNAIRLVHPRSIFFQLDAAVLSRLSIVNSPTRGESNVELATGVGFCKPRQS